MARQDYRRILRTNLLFTVDILLIAGIFYAYSKFTVPSIYNLNPLEVLQPQWFVVVLLVWFVLAAFFRLYAVEETVKRLEIIIKTALVAILTGVIYIIIPYLNPQFPGSKFHAIVFFIIFLIAMVLWRFIYATLFKHPILPKNIIIIGTNWLTEEIINTLTNHKIYQQFAYNIKGIFSENRGAVKDKKYVSHLLTDFGNLYEYVQSYDIDEIIMAVGPEELLSGELYRNILETVSKGVPLIYATDLYENVTGKILVKKENDKIELVNNFFSAKPKGLYEFVNRILNIVFGFLGVLATIFFIPFIWIINLISSPGPLFYKQIRSGKDLKEYEIYKFRSMIVDAEKTGAKWASKNDNRITALGKFMRKTRIDELPQAWNMLKGDMNLIGPRPERPVFIEQLNESIPFFTTRNLIKPGLTGWAQVSYKYGNTFEDSLVKLQYDLYYIKNRNFFF